MTRAEKTEACYRKAVTKVLNDLLGLLNPRDQINFGGMSYPELVQYASDFLQTEVSETVPQGKACLHCTAALDEKTMFWKAQYGGFCDETHFRLWRKEQDDLVAGRKLKDLIGKEEPAGLSLE